MKVRRKRTVLCCVAIAIAGLFWLAPRRQTVQSRDVAPKQVETDVDDSAPLMMSDVLDMAVEAREQMSQRLSDYTARFVKQEVDSAGVLGPESEIFMKVQTRLRTEDDMAPKRVYLRFLAPGDLRGREVIWGEDLYKGKMAVHEVGLLLGLKTLWLDPNGVIAMSGQRYPISEIGMVRLVEKLIERGELDRHDPNIEVTMKSDHELDGVATNLIQIHRTKPSSREGDFSLAEIAIDPQRQLVLQYRSFGWATESDGERPLLESYTYLDVETNVGLQDSDFDHKNSEYSFPAF